LEEQGVSLKSATEPFDTLTSHGKLQFQILGSFAEFERNRIKERVFPGMVKGVKDGNWQGARYAPYGYFYDKKEKVLKIVKEEAEVVEKIFNLRMEGLSQRKIALNIQSQGKKNRAGKPFPMSLVGSILNNPIYTGKIVWNRCGYDKKLKVGKTYKYARKSVDEMVEGKGRHEPIITEEMFDAVRGIEETERRMMPASLSRQKDNDHILSGLIICGVCGEPFYGFSVISNPKTGMKKRRYRCATYSKYGKNCDPDTLTISAEKVESYAIETLRKIMGHPDVTNDCIDDFAETFIRENCPDVNAKLLHLENKLATNKEYQQRLLNDVIIKSFSPDVIAKKNYELLMEEKALNHEIGKVRGKVSEINVSIRHAQALMNVLGNIEEYWSQIPASEKKNLMRSFIKQITVRKGAISGIELCSPFNKIIEEINGKEEDSLHKNLRLSDECS
ncbi:MAG: recombinase family protein, partial [Nitrospirota bacterium]